MKLFKILVVIVLFPHFLTQADEPQYFEKSQKTQNAMCPRITAGFVLEGGRAPFPGKESRMRLGAVLQSQHVLPHLVNVPA